MRLKILLLALFFSTYIFVDSIAQTMPFVYDAENTGASYPIPYLPTLSELPSYVPLPDPFEWADGRGRMSNFSDWEYRRAEIGAQIQNYEIGVKPPRPDNITASYSDDTLRVFVTVNGKTLVLTSKVILPSGTGPFPAVIGMNSPSGSIPSYIFSDRNIAQIAYMHNQVTMYGSPSSADPYFQLYPYLNADSTGQYSAWAWGVSRLIDGLELVQNALPIDLKHIAVTGCSYAGKMALFAGAFDERVALTIAQESGGGGATSWRYSHSEPSGSVECIDNTDYNWFMNSMKQFNGSNVSHMPEDHHELMAMVAPRALFVTANPDYTWLSNPSCYVASSGAQQVYKTLGIPDRFGYSIVGGHSHCAVPSSQIPEIEAFVNKFLLGNDTANTNIADNPYNINLASWITWTNPVLSNGASYFGKAVLASPSNLLTDMDTTSITFKWEKVTGAQNYIIQLSMDPAFRSITKSDSTITDTIKTFTGFAQGIKYYWRVQVNSALGLGPWSNTWNFITTIPLPPKPQLGNVSPYPGRTGWFTFKWNKTKYANQYLIQVSNQQTFTDIFLSASTLDTTKILSGFAGAQVYYWMVQASNLSGQGQWSNISHFSTLPAPTSLVLQSSASNEITLDWNDNSTVYDGCIIERKQSPQTSFVVLDTLKGSGTEYADKTVVQGQIYTYRIKAYIDSVESDYSNEASLVITGIKETGKIPAEYSISQNYPNPFNPSTKIKFALPKTAITKIILYNVLGSNIMTLLNKELEAGFHEINFDASALTSGVYFYRIQSGEFIQTKKMILMK